MNFQPDPITEAIAVAISDIQTAIEHHPDRYHQCIAKLHALKRMMADVARDIDHTLPAFDSNDGLEIISR